MEREYYRTFIGLPLQVEQAFLDARNELLASLSGERISWTIPEQFHVTLRFLGDIEQGTVQRIGAALVDGLSVPKQIRLYTTGLGSFGPRRRPRVLWVGFEGNSFFGHLKQEVDRVLELCGFQGEEQPFRAHLTLGRIRSLRNLEKYYHTVNEMNQDFVDSVLFDRLVFYRSVLSPQGPRYLVLEDLRFPR